MAESFVGAALQFGTYDLSGQSPASRLLAEEYSIQAYVGQVADRTNPDISPLYGDLRGLPPALLIIGSLDIVLEDNLAMAARLSAAGGAADIRVYPESRHGFTTRFDDPLDGSGELPSAGGSDDHIRAVEGEVNRLDGGQGRLGEHDAPEGNRAQQAQALAPVHEPSKLLMAVREFDSYLRANAERIPNYGERRRAGEAISTAFIESAVNQVISKRIFRTSVAGGRAWAVDHA